MLIWPGLSGSGGGEKRKEIPLCGDGNNQNAAPLPLLQGFFFFFFFFEFPPLTPTYYSRCEQLIRLSELFFFFSPSSTWMRLDSPQLQPVSSCLRDVFIVALTSNPFQIPSSLYLHLFFTHPPALFRCTSPLPSSSRPVISSPPRPQHLLCFSHPLRFSVKNTFDSL